MSEKEKEKEKDVDQASLDATAAGAATGGTAGAVIGAAMAGPVGAGLGAVVGTAAGGGLGALLDYRSAEPVFRDEWERGPYKESTSWDEASAAYRYGWENFDRPEYQGRSWSDVHSDLKSRWSGTTRWEDYEPMVQSAWERRSQTPVEPGPAPAPETR